LRRAVAGGLGRLGCGLLAAALLIPVVLAAAPRQPAPTTLGPVSLEAELDQQFYREGTEAEIYVQARVRTGAIETLDEPDGEGASAPSEPGMIPTRSIAFVLDRSGSMDGERMVALQAAIAGALDGLADRDVVSVVLFGSEVETLVEAQRCELARAGFARLGPIEAAGGAALYDGLSQGAALVRRAAGPATIRQLILVADGVATKGPREPEDFARLVETLARDGITVATIGLGEEFDEDLLAAMARIGGGRFVYADAPARLGEAIQREIVPSQEIVALDADLTIEFRPNCDDVRAHVARVASVEKNTVRVRFPRLLAGQELSALASATVRPFSASGIQRDLVRAHLRWTDPLTGESRELTYGVTARFSPEIRDVDDTHNIQVYRVAVASLIREGMQEAIEQIDRGDFRRALRELRRTRARVRDVNYTAEDTEIAAMLAQLDAYIADVEARGMSLLDRKVLRSGLNNQFDAPSAEDAANGR